MFFILNSIYSQYDNYPYIKNSELESYNINKNLNIFHDKLDLVKNKNAGIKVFQIGASHVQAAFWTKKTREQFEDYLQLDSSSLGLVFPYNILKQNCPYYYDFSYSANWNISKISDKNIERNIGIMGITAYTNDVCGELNFKISNSVQSEKYKFNKITIFHNSEDTTYSLNIIPKTIVKSVETNAEQQTTTFFLNTLTDNFKFEAEKKDTTNGEFLFYGAYLENTKSLFSYCGIGINGASTSSYFKANLLFEQLNVLKPDLVIFSIGVNDAVSNVFDENKYYENYKILINSVLKQNKDCAIILTTNNDFYNYKGIWNPNQEKIAETMCRLSEYFSCSVWNLYEIMGGKKSINKWKEDSLAQKDRIHFTRDGYTILAELFFNAIIKDYSFLKKQE